MLNLKGFVLTSMTVAYSFVQFLACFYKVVTQVWCYLKIACLFFENFRQ